MLPINRYSQVVITDEGTIDESEAANYPQPEPGYNQAKSGGCTTIGQSDTFTDLFAAASTNGGQNPPAYVMRTIRDNNTVKEEDEEPRSPRNQGEVSR